MCIRDSVRPDLGGVRNHDVDADAVKMRKAGLDIVRHARCGLPGEAEQQAAVVKLLRDLRGVGLVDALVQHALAVVRVKGLHADLDVQRHALRREPLPQRGDGAAEDPVAFDVQVADALFAAYVLDLADGGLVQLGERAGVDRLQPAERAGHLRKRLAVDPQVVLLIARRIQMVVAEFAALPRAAPAAQQHDFARIFVPDHRITGQLLSLIHI